MTYLHVPEFLFYGMSSFILAYITDSYIVPCIEKKRSQKLSKTSRKLTLIAISVILISISSLFTYLFLYY